MVPPNASALGQLMGRASDLAPVVNTHRSYPQAAEKMMDKIDDVDDTEETRYSLSSIGSE